ncbi:unnamed protein product [Ophioblennius macclurei]
MATSSERSPPPFPDSEDPDMPDPEEMGGRESDEDDGEDLFATPSDPQLTLSDTSPELGSESSDLLTTPPSDITAGLLIEPLSSPTEPAAQVVAEPLDEFVDLTNNVDAADESAADAAAAGEIPSDEPSDDFVDILGSESEPQKEEVVVVADVTVEAVIEEAKSAVTDLLTDGEKSLDQLPEAKETSPASIIDLGGDLLASDAPLLVTSDKTANPLDDLLNDTPPTADVKVTSPATIDLFEDEGSDLFADPLKTKPAKPEPASFFDEPDEDLFGEPLGAISKKTTTTSSSTSTTTSSSSVMKEASVTAPAAAALSRPFGDTEPSDIFTEEAVTTTTTITKTTTVASKSNGVHSEEDTDIFAEATVELSLDSPQSERKKEAASTPAAAATTAAAAAAAAASAAAPSAVSSASSLPKPQPAAVQELEEEEDEEDDKFDIFVSVKDPEKIGDGMNAYMAYKVTTQTTLPIFRNKTLTVRRRFSDFLGLYEKLSEKHGPNGFIVPPPPEKSILGMTKVKVGKEDSSSADFVERRRGALERYLQRVVNHPSLLQDPDVREFLEREELPRAVSTQALSGAGFLKMINKATDAVSKMTIKMNESDMWFEEKLQEVESADQQFRKLHALVENLVLHRKELSVNTASFAKSAAMLGSAEDNTALSRALSQLAEVEDKMEQLHQDQAANDTFSFAELIADYIRLLGAVRGSFDQRMKAWQRWQDAQAMLQKKRETEAKLLWANKPDKLQLAKEEIAEWEAKVTQYERDFEKVSATVRKEVIRFEKEKTKNFKRQIIKYLEALLQSQQQLIKYWEAFLPEAKAIA